MPLSPEQLSALAIGAGGLADLGAGFAGMRVGQARASYQRTAAGINRDFARLQAEDVRRRGEEAARDRRAVGRRMVGAQRAAYAGQGVDVSKGSAADVQVSTQTLADLDAAQIASNAWRQAWGFEAQAENDYASAMVGADATSFDAASTFLTGGLKFANSAALAAYALDSKRSNSAGNVSAGRANARYDNLDMALPSRIPYWGR